MLGHLKSLNPAIDGLDGTQGNPLNPGVPNSPWVPVNNNAIDGGPVDPCHSFDCITIQVFGSPIPVSNKTAPVRMDGFAVNTPGGAKNVPFVMSAFNSTNLPVLSTLAMEYAVFDAWHVSAPTCTNPNREFMMSGTSHGFLDNTLPDAGFPQQTHFQFLEAHGVSWKSYYGDSPWMMPAFADCRTPAALNKTLLMPHFFDDLKNGGLAQYTLIQPTMATSKTQVSNWQHVRCLAP